MSMIYNTTVSTKHPAVSSDAQGTDVENFTTGTWIDRHIPASVQQATAREVANFQRREFDADYKAYTDSALEAGKGDRLINDLTSEIFEIKIPSKDMAGRGRKFVTVVKLLGTDS